MCQHTDRRRERPWQLLHGGGQRFRYAATTNIIVTVRVRDVEQVFCTGQGGASIAFADLTVPSPAFRVVAPPEVESLNGLVAAMIR